MRDFFIVFIDFFSLENRFFKLRERLFFFFILFYSILSFFKVEFIRNIVYFFFYIFSPVDKISKSFENHLSDLKTRTILFTKFSQIESIINENQIMKNKILEQDKLLLQYKKYEEFEKIVEANKFSVNSFIYPLLIINKKEMIARFETGKKINLNDFILSDDNFLFGKVVGVNNLLKMVRISMLNDRYINIPSAILNRSAVGTINNGINISISGCDAIFVPNEDRMKEEIVDNDIVVTFSDENLVPNNINIGYVKKIKNVICVNKNENKNLKKGVLFSITGGKHYIIENGFDEN